MPQITTGRDAALLQLQYVTESLGMRRTYLQDDTDGVDGPAGVVGSEASAPSLSGLTKPIPMRADTAAVKRPDIEWYPDYETYKARSVRLAGLPYNRPSTLPAGFPAHIDSPRVWTGTDYVDQEKFMLRLSEADVEEIKAALAHFRGLDGDNGPDAVSRDTFPLPKLAGRLQSITENIHLGSGFNVIRGLDPTDFSPLDNLLVYLGLTSYIAQVRGCQDYDGRMVVHIMDTEKNLPGAIYRPSPYTSRAQPFHTDMCDILAMYVLDASANGGESLLASSAAIYNELAATRPDLIHVLADNNWIHDEFDKTKSSWFHRPLLYNFDTHGPSFLYSRRPLTGAPFSPHHPDVPAMTEEQAEALDAVHFCAVKNQLVIKLEPGDIEIVNNMALFHARNGFTDVEESFSSPPLLSSVSSSTSENSSVTGDYAPSEAFEEAEEPRLVVHDNSEMAKKSVLRGTRHVLRLWLRSADGNLAWKIPAPLESNSYKIYGDRDTHKVLKRWDVHRAPPINRTLIKHFACS